MRLQDGVDRLFRLLDAAVDAAPDLAAGRQGKETFDLVEPPCIVDATESATAALIAEPLDTVAQKAVAPLADGRPARLAAMV